MQDDWEKLAQKFWGPFHTLASRIGAPSVPNLELLWLLIDFGECCLRYFGLLLLANSSSLLPLRAKVLAAAAREGLARPTLGVWIGLLQEVLKKLDAAGPESAIVRLLVRHRTQINAFATQMNRIRKPLAHGFWMAHPSITASAPRAADEVLQLVLELRELLERPLIDKESRLHFASGDQDEAVDLYPFVVRSQGLVEPLFYASLKKLTKGPAIYVGNGQTHESDDLGVKIREFLSGMADFGQLLPVATATLTEGRERSNLLVHRFRLQALSDEFAEQHHFRHLPKLAGRPALGRHLKTALCSSPVPIVYHLFGRRGIGKQAFLAELMAELVAEKKLVVHVSGVDLMQRGIDQCCLTPLQMTGTLDDLLARLKHEDSNIQLVVVVTGLETTQGIDHCRHQILELIRRTQFDSNFRLLLASNSEDPVRLTKGYDSKVISLPMPAMEPDSADLFYSQLASVPWCQPRQIWRLLPPSTRSDLRFPDDLAEFCKRYHSNDAPADFSITRRREERWKEDVADRPFHLKIVATLAVQMLYSRRRVAETPDLKHSEEKRAWQDLESLGIVRPALVDDDTGTRRSAEFASFHLLALALVHSLPPLVTDGTIAVERIDDVLIQCDEFFPFCEALAIKSSEFEERTMLAVIERAAAHTGNAAKPLMEALLTRAYAFPFFAEAAETALQSPHESVLSGCFSAAQRLCQSGQPEAEAFGLWLMTRLWETAETRGFERLTAHLFNDLALQKDTQLGREERMKYFSNAAAMARRLNIQPLYHSALNNLGYEILEESSEHLSRARVDELVNQLRPLVTSSPTLDNALAISTSLRLIIRATLLTNQSSEIEICQHFDKAKHAARRSLHPNAISQFSLIATDFADYLLSRKRLNEAIEQHQEAVDWAEVSGNEKIITTCLRNRARCCRALYDVGQRQPQLLAQADSDEARANRLETAGMS